MNTGDGSVTRHGFILDQDGRVVFQVYCKGVGSDGAVYMSGTIWPRAGSPYSPRLRDDSCFMVLKDFKPEGYTQ